MWQLVDGLILKNFWAILLVYISTYHITSIECIFGCFKVSSEFCETKIVMYFVKCGRTCIFVVCDDNSGNI